MQIAKELINRAGVEKWILYHYRKPGLKTSTPCFQPSEFASTYMELTTKEHLRYLWAVDQGVGKYRGVPVKNEIKAGYVTYWLGDILQARELLRASFLSPC